MFWKQILWNAKGISLDLLAVKNLKTRLRVLNWKLTVGYTFRSFSVRDPLLSITCGGGEIFVDQMDYRGNDGRSSGRQQTKKSGVWKNFLPMRGVGWGAWGYWDQINFMINHPKFPLFPPPKVMNNDQFLKYIYIREDNRFCSNSYVKLDITKILQRKCWVKWTYNVFDPCQVF